MPVRTVKAVTGTGAWIPLSVHDGESRIQIAVNTTNEGRVEYTLDNVLDADVSAYAVTEYTFAAATAAEMAHPAAAVRVVMTSGTSTLRVLQTGNT